MNNIEFKALVKGLFLTQEQVRQIGGYKDQRQIRRFVSGEQPPHKDLVKKLQQLDLSIDEAVAHTVHESIKSKATTVTTPGYKNQEQYNEWSNLPLQFIELHLCLLSRAKKEHAKHGIEFRIVPFDADATEIEGQLPKKEI